MALCFVLDANLFISLARVGSEDIVKMLVEGAEKLGAELVTTPQVLDEVGNLPTVEGGQRRGMASQVRRSIHIERLPAGAVDGLREVLGRRGPQATDLSLMEVARQRAGQGQETMLVSNDFKIHITARKLNHPYRVASPAVLLHTLAEGTRGKLHQRFTKLYHQLREAEMAYMLKKHTLFPAHPKLTWLIDNLLTSSMAHPGPQGQPEAGPDNIQEGPVDLKPLYHHLRGEPILDLALEPFQNLIPHIQPLENVLGYRESLQEMLTGGWYYEALTELMELIDHLQLNLVRGSTQLEYRERLWLRQLFAGELLLLYQAAGLLRLALGEGKEAEADFDRATLLALVAEQPLKGARMHYLHGLARLHQGYPLGGVRAFQLALGLVPLDSPLRLRCRLALALAQLKLGEGLAAEQTMERLRKDLEQQPAIGAWELARMGDELYHFGLPEFAGLVYREGLEWALTAGEKGVEPAQLLVPRLSRTRSFLPGGAADLARQLQRLVRLTGELEATRARDDFQAALAQLRAQEVPLHEFMGQDFAAWSPGHRLPEAFLEPWEIVAAIPLEEGVATSAGLGSSSTELVTATAAAAAIAGPLWPEVMGEAEGALQGAWTAAEMTIDLCAALVDPPPHDKDDPQAAMKLERTTLLICNHPTLGTLAFHYPEPFAKGQTESYGLRPLPEGEFKLLAAGAAQTGPFTVRGVLAARTPEALSVERSVGLLSPEDMGVY